MIIPELKKVPISEFRISNFRGLRNLNLEELGSLNLLVGTNNSGKTSVLEAISLACKPLDSFQWLKVARGRDVQFGRSPVIESIKWLFPQESETKNSGDILLAQNGSCYIKSIVASFEEIRALPVSDDNLDQEEESEILAEPGASIKVKAAAVPDYMQTPLFESATFPSLEEHSLNFHLIEGRDFLQTNRRKFDFLSVPSRTILPHSHRVDRILHTQFFENLDSSELLIDDVINLLKEFDPEIENLYVHSKLKGNNLFLKHKNIGDAPIQIFGDGLRRILQFAMVLPLCKDGILLIDEIETSIHAKRLVDSFKWLSKACKYFNVQLFATTHSLEAVDALLLASAQYEDLITYKLNEKGSEQNVSRFDKSTLENLRNELGMEVRW